ncbi:UDP-N-acetylmuramate--L-alanyl-gamma-D-glutamyl-meso-2,6-diaminoheptandioate ligase [Methylacidimicrobium sp. AP8]|uniref:UDP-N-acetylmuramate--L-alanine ligase n=1 Tax=Methylacidimicrobium sp. AP8 TaxID=2730359 RepID=UPI0018C0DCB8|nr:Mur ligase family protein [Methylacidimicrobium sp. AP8]CAB4242466.1 UDP-N-acetylmuramate--L-alanyl-gamma-D-glutamyl-meso-2,6-diaminoheptandioate ligase [Methylacidimicrobium sp. AP8]
MIRSTPFWLAGGPPEGRARLHFLGICGTAMGAAAAMLQEEGWRVGGSDESVYPPLSTFLASRGVPLHEGYRPENLPKDPGAIIIVGNAIRRGNPELEAVLEEKRLYLSLPELLKLLFLWKSRNFVVAGTHGKTTTASLLAWLFAAAGKNPSFLIGGLPENFGAGGHKGNGDIWVLEGDEYDTAFFDKRSKFLHYLPEVVLINNIEFDHADIFPDLASIQLSFRRLVQLVPRTGRVFVNADDPNSLAVCEGSPAPVTRVGFGKKAEIPIRVVRYFEEGSEFEMLGRRLRIPLVGELYVRNAAMAVAAAVHGGVSLDTIAEKGLPGFRGVRRRGEVHAEVGGVTIVDDFGHHPTAIRETLRSLRLRFPDRRLWAIFEPRSNTTRRAVFQQALPEALQGADGIFLADVARKDQLPDSDRLDPRRVVEDLRRKGRLAFFEPDADAITAHLLTLVKSGDVLVIFSNGGFDGIQEKLTTALRQAGST